MNKKNLKSYSLIPLKQIPNRVWRTYTGGDLIDEWKNTSPGDENNMPEEWIMSTISARGKNRPENEGLSVVLTPSGPMSLRELIASDPELFLGEKVAHKFGTTGVLIKIIDSAERLTIQVHPDKKYAKEMLNSEFGKTEAWFILGSREINGEKPSVYLGFREGITEEIWKELFLKQDIRGMLGWLHRFDVNQGDAYIIHGGIPHAIGSGCFLLEIQEPTDYTMRVEKITPGGLKISDELIHQGVGIENMLRCFHYDGFTFEEAERNWKVIPRIIESSGNLTLRSVIGQQQTECFSLNELILNGEMTIHGDDIFSVCVICSGEGSINCNGIDYDFSRGDEIFFPAAIEKIIFNTRKESRILFCYPPS